MREAEYRKIQTNFERLVEELDLTHTGIIDKLFEDNVLSHEEKEELSKISTTPGKSRRLLAFLKTKEDAAYGKFRDAVLKHQPFLESLLELPGVPRRIHSSKRSGGGGKAFDDFTVKDLQGWLEPHLQKENIPCSILNKISNEDINGKVFMNMTDEELKEVFSDLKFGERKRLTLLRDEAAGKCSLASEGMKPALPLHQQKQHVRQFAKSVKATEKYYQSRVLNVHEACSDSSLLNPMRQFLPCIEDSVRADIYAVIGEKVVIFAAACMNDRRNGTIYFGVGNSDCELYQYGEVLGIPLNKKDCEDEIMRSVMNSFSKDTVDAVQKCIHIVFVEVVLPDKKAVHSHFICEVDIEPRSDIVGDRSFFVNAADTASFEKKLILYRIVSGSPREQSTDEVLKFAEEKTKLLEERKKFDQKPAYSQTQTRNLTQFLKDFLCGGTDKLDGSFCHLLAVGAVDTSEADTGESLQFVADMDWRGILDFDSQSDEKSLYRHMDQDKEMLYRVMLAEEFTSSESKKQVDQATENQDLDFQESVLKPWIFCNGQEEIGEKGYNIKQWKRDRSPAFRETVAHFVCEFPKERAVVVILLTSMDDVFMEASEELVLRFPDQWVMIAESEHLANQWIDGLQQRSIEVDLHRCLCNFTLAEINRAMHQLMDSKGVLGGECFVMCSSGVEEEISKKQLQELCDLEIVSSRVCHEIPEDAKQLSEKHKENFYKGNQATWWNFHFPGQVCPRDKLEDLKTKTRAVLDGDVEEGENAGFVAVYHQPGAGGTTVAMNVLWDLHTEFKTCNLKRVTTDTARQIVTLHAVGESSQRKSKPVLVMIDNTNDDQVNELKRHIEEECQNRDMLTLVCVFLICIRCMSLPTSHRAKNIYLQQKLSPREKQFFMFNYTKLKKKGNVNMDHLLGFNIMKEDFNEDYIRNTVDQFVGQYREHEQTLLQYIAMLNFFDLNFRAVPVCCFDQLMSQKHGRGPWESQFDPDPLVLFTTNHRMSGRNKCLRVTSQLLCSYILDKLEKERSESRADVMENFLCSASFPKQRRDFASKDLLNIVCDCMKKRGMDSTGKRKSRFSPFIQMLVDLDRDADAIRLINTVFESTDDAFIAQQIARIYIFRMKLDDATVWAKTAITKQPRNSFVLDTLGQIYKSRLTQQYESSKLERKVDTREAVKAVKHAYAGCQIFQKVQDLNDKERYDPPNTSGHFGQMEIVILLKDILHFCPDFPSKDDLQTYLSGSDKMSFVSELSLEEVRWLVSMEDQAFSCLREVENQKTCSSSDTGHTQANFFLGEDNIRHFEKKLNERFAEVGHTARNPECFSRDGRWQEVTKLGGHSLYSVMMQCGQGPEGKENANKIWDFTSLSLNEGITNLKFRLRNLNMALASALTLTSCHGHEFTEKEYRGILQWSTELFEQTKVPQTNGFIDFDPYIFLFAFHWPAPNQKQLKGRSRCEDLKKGAELASRAFTIFRKDMRRRNNPIFFFKKSPGITRVISKTCLQELCGKLTGAKLTNLLQDPKAVETVERFSGILVKNGTAVKVKLESALGNETEIHIRLFVPEKASLWNKQVSFVLGVGLGGPVACKLQLVNADSSQSAGRSRNYPKHDLQTREHAGKKKQKP